MKPIWLEAIVVDDKLEKMCVIVGGFELRQPKKDRWSVLVCDGFAGKEFFFGVNEEAARLLYDTLDSMVDGGRGGRVFFNEKTMEIKK